MCQTGTFRRDTIWANAYGIRLEVIQLASKLQEEDNSLGKVDAHQMRLHKLNTLNEEV